MRKILASILERIAEWLKDKEIQGSFPKENESVVSTQPLCKEVETAETQEIGEDLVSFSQSTEIETAEKMIKTKKSKEDSQKVVVLSPLFSTVPIDVGPVRDVMYLMDIPLLALSKNRTQPLIYASSKGTRKFEVTRHSGHFLASIYDWDIILVVSGKIQEILNNGSDIPSRTIAIPRHELLKALYKTDERKTQKALEKSLTRLKATLIDMTDNNDRYQGGFIESWEYKERVNAREKQIIRITISEWLYKLSCYKGGLLKTDPRYFKITSGLERFLYRTARRHAGKKEWEFSLEKLYEKSGSENDFRKFKSKLKAAVRRDPLPGYATEWIDRDGKIFVGFKKISDIEELDRVAEECERLIEFKEESGIQ